MSKAKDSDGSAKPDGGVATVLHASDMLDDWQYPRYVELFRKLRAQGRTRYTALVFAFMGEGLGGARHAIDWAMSRPYGRAK